jgi:hypothetical protein
VARKKILLRAAAVGFAVLVAALGTALVTHVRDRQERGRLRAAREESAAKLAKEYQASLDEMAQKIKALPVDPKVIGEIQTTHFQQRPERALYVWATANDGRFLFGVPADAFARLNTVYDQNQEVIAKDNHFASRDRFLRALLHHPGRLEPIRPRNDDDRKGRRGEEEWWRFYQENDDWGRPALHLSSPIQDAGGTTVGNLNLKLVETAPDRFQGSDLRDVSQVATVVAVFSLLWLWFLVPSWVYIDAQQRHVPRPLLWALLTLVGNVVALLVYLISRPEDGGEQRCPQCGKALHGAKAGCPYCGADLSAVFCARCQYPLKPEWGFCPGCRTAVGDGPAHREGPGSAPPPDPAAG